MEWSKITSDKTALSLIAIVFVIFTIEGLFYASFLGEDGIINDVDYTIAEEDAQAHWDEYKAVTVNVDNLRQALDNGNLSLKLLDEDVSIIIFESDKADGYYRGYANGVAANQAEFSFGENAFSCYVDLGTHSYQIAPSWDIVDNKMIYAVYMTDYKKEEQRHEEYPIDPLTFEISNEDNLKHNISIEVFNPSSSLIFSEEYSISPGEVIVSPDISEFLGKHRYVVVLDGDYEFEESATVARSTGLGSSEKLYFNFINNSEYPMEVGIEVA
ncbi:hypothetical protein MettiDRAFT_0367 [Methanolobus tindarius DSM 2278]|uniref:Uncharacterized protein n=1 Tax=Methanolobus tindarius DSM 2278 TaxID=1090322 RepID=W9DTE5_METTI|nr:hypothetical protein [Methanolobus tindarius]ETA66962.1 hypothetical protein MettiDRAFT_0367 [Methanolobus tindarius DSM 2278]